MAYPLGVAVLGSGNQALRWAAALRRVPALRLAGLWSADPARAARSAGEAGTSAFPDLDAAWKDAGIGAVLVAAGSTRHADLGLQAAAAGRHVLVEKPIDVSVEKAASLVADCRRRNLRLAVASQKRFTPRFRRIKDAIARGMLGDPVSASVLVRIRRGPEYFREGNGWRGDQGRGGGVLLNQGVHYADLLCWWLGEPVDVRGLEGRRSEGVSAPGTVAGTLRFASGAVATLVLTASDATPLPEFFEIAGTRGAIQLEGGRVRVWDVPGEMPRGLLGPLTGKLPLPLRLALTKEALTSPVDGTLEDQLTDFARAVADGSDPFSSGEDGLRALRLVQALAS
jgi:predicted dehydrogenase